MPSIASRLGKRNIVFIVMGVVLAGGLIYFFKLRNNSGAYQFVTVTKGPIAETVSVTGNTTPVQSLDLGFESGGTIASVRANVGARVNPGDVIASLDTRDLQTQLAQAQANVDAQNAKLRSLQAGAQPADIQASQAALQKSEQDLSNLYSGASDTMSDAYVKSADAVRNQLAPFFLSPETNNPQLTFTINNSQTLNNVDFGRVQASGELNALQNELLGVNAASPSSTLELELQKTTAHLAAIKAFLTGVTEALTEATNLSASNADAFRTALAAALNEVNAATANVNGVAQNIASQKIAVTQLQAQLNLKLAGATASDIQAQQAQVEQAQASADSIRVKIAKSSLASPIEGVITVQNAKVGQIATPGDPLISIISDNNLEIDAAVPETDIGKVSVGNSVSMTFDAFQNETFDGKVFYIDPAATVVQGVVDYKIKVSLDKADPRIKSGLTANLDIKTQEKTDALILPQFAILQNDSGTFVEVLQNGAVTQVPVTLGLRDDKGNVEVASGVTEGEQVLNIGLKQGS